MWQIGKTVFTWNFQLQQAPWKFAKCDKVICQWSLSYTLGEHKPCWQYPYFLHKVVSYDII